MQSVKIVIHVKNGRFRSDGSTTVTTERPDGSSTITDERPVTGGTQTTVTETTTETGTTVSSTTVEHTDAKGNTISTSETTYTSQDGATVTQATTSTDADGNMTNQATATITVAPSDEGTVTVSDDAVIEAVSQIGDATSESTDADKVISIRPSDGTSDSVSIVIAPESILTIAESGASLEISGDVGTVSASAEVSQTLSQQTEPVSVTIQVADRESMSAVQQDAVGDRPTYQLLAVSGGQEIHDLGGTVTVSVSYTLSDGEVAESITVNYVDDDGVMHAQPMTYADGVVTFTTTHFSYYTIQSEIVPPSEEGDDMTLYIGAIVVVIVVKAIAAVVYTKYKA